MCLCRPRPPARSLEAEAEQKENEKQKENINALKNMSTSSYFLKLSLGTTVRPCEVPATTP